MKGWRLPLDSSDGVRTRNLRAENAVIFQLNYGAIKHLMGIEPTSTGWKPVALPLSYKCRVPGWATPRFSSRAFACQEIGSGRLLRPQHTKRLAGNDPASPAWQAGALPLSYRRVEREKSGKGIKRSTTELSPHTKTGGVGFEPTTSRVQGEVTLTCATR